MLITGIPGVGKTTLIKQILSEYKKIKFAGFYTQEVRKKGRRTGFQLVWIPQNTMEILSSVNLNTPYKLGKYRVNKDVMDEVALRIQKLQNIDVLILDEIGPMELFSTKFKGVVIDILHKENLPVLGTIQMKLLGKLKEWGVENKVIVKELTRGNFESVYKECVYWLASLGKKESSW